METSLALIDFLSEPFTFDYMRRAFWLTMLTCGVCAILSGFLILRGWSLLGDALAHAVLPGVAAAYILQWPYALGAMLAGGMASWSMTLIQHSTRLRADAVMGLVFTAFLAIGLLLASMFPVAVNLQALVLGNPLAIAEGDLWQCIGLSLVALILLFCRWRDLQLLFFDPQQAQACGLPILRLKFLFFALLTSSIVAALQAVGAVLVMAMLVTPGAAAFLLTRHFPRLLLLAWLMGVASAFLGTYLSFFLDGATGGMIVLVQATFFILALFLKSRQFSRPAVLATGIS